MLPINLIIATNLMYYINTFNVFFFFNLILLFLIHFNQILTEKKKHQFRKLVWKLNSKIKKSLVILEIFVDDLTIYDNLYESSKFNENIWLQMLRFTFLI